MSCILRLQFRIAVVFDSQKFEDYFECQGITVIMASSLSKCLTVRVIVLALIPWEEHQHENESSGACLIQLRRAMTEEVLFLRTTT